EAGGALLLARERAVLGLHRHALQLGEAAGRLEGEASGVARLGGEAGAVERLRELAAGEHEVGSERGDLPELGGGPQVVGGVEPLPGAVPGTSGDGFLRCPARRRGEGSGPGREEVTASDGRGASSEGQRDEASRDEPQRAVGPAAPGGGKDALAG